jgi:hypothetical protein
MHFYKLYFISQTMLIERKIKIKYMMKEVIKFLSLLKFKPDVVSIELVTKFV